MRYHGRSLTPFCQINNPSQKRLKRYDSVIKDQIVETVVDPDVTDDTSCSGQRGQNNNDAHRLRYVRSDGAFLNDCLHWAQVSPEHP